MNIHDDNDDVDGILFVCVCVCACVFLLIGTDVFTLIFIFRSCTDSSSSSGSNSDSSGSPFSCTITRVFTHSPARVPGSPFAKTITTLTATTPLYCYQASIYHHRWIGPGINHINHSYYNVIQWQNQQTPARKPSQGGYCYSTRLAVGSQETSLSYRRRKNGIGKTYWIDIESN